MEFEWDPVKATSNRRKHGVTFEEALTVFQDPNAIDWYDSGHSGDEDRFVVIGVSRRSRLLFVV